MTVLLYCWFLLSISVACLGQSPYAVPDLGFDCRRNQVTCSNNGDCDLLTGQCDCGTNATNVNYKCQDLTESGTCAPPCENDGICANSICVCGENYYGASCEMERVLVACEADEMFINVYPDEKFIGAIYVNGYNSEPDCQLGKDTGDPKFGEPDKIDNAANLIGWRRAFPHEGSVCGNVTGVEKTDAETGAKYTSFSRQFFLQYNQNFKSSVDQIITAECKVANGTATVYSDVNTITESDSDYNQVNAEDDVDTVTLKVQDKAGVEVTKPVVLGSQLRLVFTMLPGSGYADFRLSSCSANNAVENTTSLDYKHIQFLENGCPSSDAKAIFNQIPVKTPPATNTSATISTVFLKAFMFTGDSPKVAFECAITFCTDANIDDCKQPVCPGFSSNAESSNTAGSTGTDTVDENVDVAANVTGVARRKREADDSEIVRREISVIDPLTQVQEIKESLAAENTKECIEEPNIMAAVIILVIVVVLLLVVLSVMVYRQSKMRNKQSATNMGYEPDHVPVQTMRIPRLEVNTSHNEPC